MAVNQSFHFPTRKEGERGDDGHGKRQKDLKQDKSIRAVHARRLFQTFGDLH
ncbi:MAG: hypothetical protein ACLRTQ_06280 [Candidatus Borkfalkia sp.]